MDIRVGVTGGSGRLMRVEALAAAVASLTLTGAPAMAQGFVVDPSQAKMPPVVLGERVEGVRQGLRIRPIVVIVKDAAAYCAAIEQWKAKEKYPVLIDDGSDGARENIARFVNGFLGGKVVRWAPEPAQAWPADPAQRRERVDRAFAGAWDASDIAGARAEWKEDKLVPPGVVVMSPLDPAWTAGLALAAWRGEELVWTQEQPAQPGDLVTPEQFNRVNTAILDWLGESTWSWNKLGDDIEAVTLCLNMPSKVKAVGGGGIEHVMAVTDRIGRHSDGSRWAWCGQIFGSEAEAAYRAMSGLFMHIKSGWAFDGYPTSEAGLAVYSLKPVIALMSRSKFDLAFDPSRTSVTAWRNAVRAGISADVVHVNTRGGMWSFDLNPGTAWSTDVPLLRTPAVVHFIHSFSAQVVHHRTSVAGRWLDNGAHAYFGSVDEPFLGSFVSGPDFFRRFALLSGPLACSVRHDELPAWKLNLYGDPLILAGRSQTRLDPEFPADSPLHTAVPLEESFKQHLKSGRLNEAASELVMLGRDKDAVRLAVAGIAPGADGKPRPGASSLARIAMPSAFRDRDLTSLVTLFMAMNERERNDPYYSSLLWQAARPELEGSPSPELIGALSVSVRELSALEDLTAITPHIRRISGRDAIKPVWDRVIAFHNDADTRAKLKEGLREALMR